jgi:hypothetical protein
MASLTLFDTPSLAEPGSPDGAIAGGLGTGSFRITPAGAFTGWRMEPASRPLDQPVVHDRLLVWARRGRDTFSRPLAAHRQSRLFPFTWTEYGLADSPLVLESAGFSPLLPGETPERSLPLYLLVFRAHNPTDDPIEAALMLTWACGWPDLLPDSEFDFQHDNLCLTGSLGSPASPNRQGIAVPDLHYAGIYQQGIEPWVVPGELDEVVEDFAEDGELDPRVVRSAPHGTAAWVKFDLEPGERKETPFVLAWHFPRYDAGPSAGAWRNYTQYLGRHRPDNAIVWLAEQAVQHFGAETANYKYWMQQIRDWQEGLGPRAREVCAALEACIESGVTWPCESAPTAGPSLTTEQLALVRSVWPDIHPLI